MPPVAMPASMPCDPRGVQRCSPRKQRHAPQLPFLYLLVASAVPIGDLQLPPGEHAPTLRAHQPASALAAVHADLGAPPRLTVRVRPRALAMALAHGNLREIPRAFGNLLGVCDS